MVNDLPELPDQHSSFDRHTISSSLFKYNGIECIIEDNGSGILKIVQPTANLHKKIIDIGTVNYDTGTINLINFNIDSYEGNELKIYAKSKDSDITVGKNTILLIEPSEIKLIIETVRV